VNPGRYNISVYQGTTFTLAPIWLIDGAVVNVTGYTAKMQVREAADASSVIIELSTTNSRISVNGAAGQFTLTLTSTETAALTAGDYVYDMNITSAGGVVTKLLQGSFVVLDSVTA
jgi:hypothetical protein